MKNILVGQSGGPTAVINSSLYGVVNASINSVEIDKTIGMLNGIEGYLAGKTIDFQKELSQQELELLKTTPGAYLGSCRYMLPDDLNDPVYSKLFNRFEHDNIGYVLYIGGNDSMDTVSKISRYAKKVDSDVKILGIPKTIDNDLVLTDHTPGFASAAKFVASGVREIVTDASVYDKPAVTIVEIMGRHAGWLTAASVLARRFEGDAPYLIYLPETDFNIDEFVNSVKRLLVQHNAVVVCVSEGINDKNGKFICEYASSTGTDSFGHKMLAGAGKFLENTLRDKLGCKARSVEFNVAQRCSCSLMSATDQSEAISAGKFGVDSVVSGKTGFMVSFVRKSGSYDVECGLEDVDNICNKEKKVPDNMICGDGSDISKDFIEYAAPLVRGKVDIPVDNFDLPKFIYRK